MTFWDVTAQITSVSRVFREIIASNSKRKGGNIMKRICIIVLSILLMATLFAGCRRQPNDGSAGSNGSSTNAGTQSTNQQQQQPTQQRPTQQPSQQQSSGQQQPSQQPSGLMPGLTDPTAGTDTGSGRIMPRF